MPKDPLIGQLYHDPTSPLYIPKDLNVLLVGPGILPADFEVFSEEDLEFDSLDYCLPMDPNVLTLSSMLGIETSCFDIIDLAPKKKRGGYHDWKLVKNFYQELEALIYPDLDIVVPNFIQGDVTKKGVLSRQYDLILDHVTWWFSIRNRESKVESYRRLAKSYQNRLNTHGRVFTFYTEKNSDHRSVMWETFSRQFSLVNHVQGFKDVHSFSGDLAVCLELLCTNNLHIKVVEDNVYFESPHQAIGCYVWSN